jgi:hypothetical protein
MKWRTREKDEPLLLIDELITQSFFSGTGSLPQML